MLELKTTRRRTPRMARMVALFALAACLTFLGQSYLVQARVIVRRQAVEDATEVLPTATVDPVDDLTTIIPSADENANNKVATTPPRPNDRFEQFPADGLASDGSDGSLLSAGSTSADESDVSSGSSLLDTAERQSSGSVDEDDSASVTTVAPSGEESMSRDTSSTDEDSSAALSGSSLSTNESEISASRQQSEPDESATSEDSTETPVGNGVASSEPSIVVASAITTPAPTVAPPDQVSDSGSGNLSSSSELRSSDESQLSSSSVSSAQEQSESSSTAEQDGAPEPEKTNPEVRVADEDATAIATATGDADEPTTVPASAQAEPETDTSAPSDSNSGPSDPERPDREPLGLSRYTAPANTSEDGADSSIDASAAKDSLSAKDLTTEDVSSTGVTIPAVVAESEDASNGIAPERSAERSQLEINTFEVASNELERNQTQRAVNATNAGTLVSRTKKGKFLDQFNEETTEDNDINLPNGAAWALAGMRMVDRKQPDATEVTAESVTRDDSENVVANNTLKQLMDWAMIMQEADFANSTFVRSTVASDEPGTAKDRRTYANKAPSGMADAEDGLGEENRLPGVATEVPRIGEEAAPVTEAEDANVLDTTFVPSTEQPGRGSLELEDFKFEDRPSAGTATRENVGSNMLATTTRRTYAVSENVDESELTAGGTRIRNTPELRVTSTTTTQRSDVNTGIFEDVPVTTYSPAASGILRRTEQTTRPVPLTTMVPFVRRLVTTTDVPMRDITTTLSPTTTAGAALREDVATKALDLEESTDSSEVNRNLLNRTDERPLPVTTVAPGASVTTMVPNHLSSSVTLTNSVDSGDSSPGENLIGQASVTTDRSDQTTTEENTEDARVPIVMEDKRVFETTTTTVPTPTTTRMVTTSTQAQTTFNAGSIAGAMSEAFTTRRTIDRSMTTTELSEEESVTEEDYIELNNAPGSSSGQGDQNQTGRTEQEVPRQTNGTTEQSQGEPAAEEDNSVVVAVVASIVSVIVVLLLIAAFMYYPPLQIVFRKRQNQVSYGQRCRPVGLDAYSLDNVSVYNSVRRKGNTARMSKRSYGNSAFEDPNFKTNPLTVAELANIIHNKTAIYDEFKEIPNVTARADEVPEGCEDKNRYANVVPLPETRVHLKRLNDDEKTEYINANFVKGPKDSANYYIACQAPMENTINDFWRLIWEQNSKVIIMATDLSENGVEKCAEYLPPSVVLDNSRTFGDFQLTLKNRENKEKYTISTVHMRHTPSNNLREIMHFWYQWPDTGVPIDESSIIGMLLEARTYLKLSPSELAEFATIAEEPEESPKAEPQTAPGGAENGANNNNNNNNNTANGTAGAGKEPISIVSNGGTNTMDKHKSLQRTQGPLTVHCSPGTGRTGTLVACDIALRLLEVPPRTVDLPQIVYYVRRGRASAVRTREQYELVYRVANVYATKLTGPTIET
ncbi:serine-rich adhesin for platelets [Anopheles nili]|uniref:serine-rich adhesin for platelets n=1 Tax=Anopheles nili TaxID=185578 RepID=UPI00237C3D7D|nr:serine-rich adhesin for platelets [Anopheles nili]